MQKLKTSVIGLLVAGFASLTMASTAGAGPIFVANLDGSQEAPPVATPASGSARFEFNDALTEMSYELNVFDITEITQAHIHIAPPGVNGPITVFLFPLMSGGTGPVNGLLASGVITATDLIGPLAGSPLTDLLAVMEAGVTYANVHTLSFPAGEVRGQIAAVPEPETIMLLAPALALLFLFPLLYRAKRNLSS